DRGIGAPSGAPHFAQIPVAPDQIYRPSSPEEARADVREMASRRPDVMKVWVDDLLGTAPKMSPEIYKAVIDESHRLGFRVAAHIYYLEDAKRLLRAGVDIIAHGVRDQPVDDEMVELLKSRRVFYIPTIQLDESFYIYAESPDFWNEQFFQAALQPALKKHLQDPLFIARTKANPNLPIFKASVANNKKNLKTIFDAGTKVSMGTDSGAVPLRIPGFAEHRELQLMVDAGLTPMQAIQIATRNAAEAIGVSDRGTLVRDKLADFIILSANPLDNIKNTETIVSVWHHGVKVHGPVTTEIGG
ncbi:MAG: amidohydrolase family protein, partial [Verrucomicrobia bacterium]|nr:amidohydrolase family protein [Verrucomicrobiota bacterium]